MRSIFSPHGERALTSIMDSRTLLAFDFDGTLAPIVPRPEDARSPISISRAMSQLAKVAPIAIISGRAVADLRSRLHFEPRYIIGNHGAEGMPGQIDREQDRSDVAEWEKQILAGWDTLPQGVLMENKQYSLSLHYRMAANRDEARLALERLLMPLLPAPRMIGGKCVINLLPADAADKFDALIALQKAEGAKHVLFVGDDETDEAAFRKALPDWLTIRIGQKDDSAARFYLNSQSEMATLIQRIERVIRAKQRHG